MLIGEYLHTLDPKKRLSLPAKFRKEVGKHVVVTRGLDKCLFMYSQSSWKGIMEKLEKLPVGQSNTRGITRFILAGAVEIEVDRAGRILIPEYLKEFAGSRVVWSRRSRRSHRDLGREHLARVQSARSRRVLKVWRRRWAIWECSSSFEI
jgi:hypothetical protein